CPGAAPPAAGPATFPGAARTELCEAVGYRLGSNDFAELGDPIDSISTPMRHVVCPTARHPAATRPARPAHHPAATRPARPAHHPAATRPYHPVPSPGAAGPARSTTVPAPCTRPP